MVILLDSIIHSAIDPALRLLPRAMDSDRARQQLLATGLQESEFRFRAQKVHGSDLPGPARGFWQTERPTVQLLMTNEMTKDHMCSLCRAQKIPFDSSLIHARLQFDDVLAAGCARLIYWADPRPLPMIGAPAEEGWQCYFRNWRPGHPRRERWDAFWALARAQILAQP